MENLLNQNNTLEDMAMNFPESLRAYANWCDEHPTLQQNASINTYGETAQQAKGIMLAFKYLELQGIKLEAEK
jgi:hypothetical protein